MARWSTTLMFLVLALAAGLTGTQARADALGVYFDDIAYQICRDDIASFVPFSVWIVYTEPSTTEILGFAAGFHYTGPYLRLGYQLPCDIVMPVEPEWENLQIACPEPFPTAAATPVMQIEFMNLDIPNAEATFFVDQASGLEGPGTGPHVILADGILLEVANSGPAFVMSCCGLPITNETWGTLKTLYR